MSYCTIADARNAGAHGDDDTVSLAIDGARDLIDRYTRSTFEPTPVMQRIFVDMWGRGRFALPTISVTEGTLDPDGQWTAPGSGDGFPGTEWLVDTVAGYAETPAAVSRCAGRLAAVLAPAPFTAQADAEGQPIGRPPASPIDDGTDPSPQQTKATDDPELTTGDPVADLMLTPYRRNRVMIS